MTITMSSTELVVSLLAIAAIALIIYLIVTLSRFNRTLISINSMIDANRKDIDSSIKSLPGICDNVNCITKSIKDKTDLLSKYTEENDEAAATMDLESIISNITSIVDLLAQVKGHFDERKRKNRRK